MNEIANIICNHKQVEKSRHHFMHSIFAASDSSIICALNYTVYNNNNKEFVNLSRRSDTSTPN